MTNPFRGVTCELADPARTVAIGSNGEEFVFKFTNGEGEIIGFRLSREAMEVVCAVAPEILRLNPLP